ncbi:hypothetical protein CDAR_83321 [Caerostris darwini]|uniref:Uncharacterized protein n=1 Tax=Caerostris darwini TaxID=1538125 RepID=A0AAV4VKW4_9ARAC|nr:hypothetical protein CDAR_83321 [Caerostris darwini]
MDDSIDALLLGRDVVEYVLVDNEFHHPDFSSLPGSGYSKMLHFQYSHCIKFCVAKIISSNRGAFEFIYEDLDNDIKWKDPQGLAFYLMEAVPLYFPYGYTVVSFLSYCAVACSAVVHYYSTVERCAFISDVVANVIGTVLTGHMLTGEFFDRGGWKRLSEMSEIVEQNIDLQ